MKNIIKIRMKMAIKEAKKSLKFNDVPIGCVIFDENNNFRKSLLIAVDNNQVVDLSTMTIDRDCEITLFPPIAGG